MDSLRLQIKLTTCESRMNILSHMTTIHQLLCMKQKIKEQYSHLFTYLTVLRSTNSTALYDCKGFPLNLMMQNTLRQNHILLNPRFLSANIMF